MKKKSIISLILCMGMGSSFIPQTFAAQNVNWVINENEVIRHIDREMYGINCEWSAGEESLGQWQVMDENGNYITNPKFAEAYKDTMVFARQAGASANALRWKDAVGNIASRPNHQMWGYQNGPVYTGPVEWLKAIMSATPDIKITFTVNMVTDTKENIADLVEFMTSDGSINYNGGENWGEVRKSLGLEEPVNVMAWEFGNELDWGASDPYDTVEPYVEYCKEMIPVIRAIDPDAKIMCHADTTAHANAVNSVTGERWEAWHRGILEELGDQIDFLAFHYYYPAGFVRRADPVLDRMEQDIVEITGSDRIKIIINEQAPAPNSYNYDKNNPYDYCLPHTIWGSTALAEFYLRMILRPNIVATNDHSIDSSAWCIMFRDENGNLVKSGTGEVINSFARFGVGDLLKSDLDTFGKDESSNIAGAAVKDEDGNINILFTNRYDSDPVNVSFKFANGNYRIKHVKKIHGDVRSADLWYREGSAWEYNNPDKIEITDEPVADNSALYSYTFDPLSVYALELEPTDAVVSEEQKALAEAKKYFAFGNGYDNVYINAKVASVNTEYAGAKAYIAEDGNFMISSDMLTKVFGASLVWDDSGNICTAKIGSRNFVFDVASGTVTENSKQVSDVAPATRVGDWTYFRLRNIAEMLSYSVTWDNRGIAIMGTDGNVPDANTMNMIYNTMIGG